MHCVIEDEQPFDQPDDPEPAAASPTACGDTRESLREELQALDKQFEEISKLTRNAQAKWKQHSHDPDAQWVCLHHYFIT